MSRCVMVDKIDSTEDRCLDVAVSDKSESTNEPSPDVVMGDKNDSPNDQCPDMYCVTNVTVRMIIVLMW